MPVASASGFEWDGVEYAQILSGIAAGLEGSPYRMSVHVVRDAAEGLATPVLYKSISAIAPGFHDTV